MMDRRIALIKILIRADDAISSTSLSKRLGVSKKTILNDLKAIQSQYLEKDLQITKKSGIGIKLTGSAVSRQQLADSIDSYGVIGIDGMQERQLDFLMNLFLSNENIYIKNIAFDSFISRTTVNRDIREINQNFLAKYELKIKNTQNGLVVVGKEEKKRLALARIVLLKCDRKLQFMAIKSDDFVQNMQKLLGLNLEPLIDLVNKLQTDFHVRFAINSQRSLLVHLAVSIVRIKVSAVTNDNKTVQKEMIKHQNELKILKNDLTSIENVYEVSFDNEELYLIFLHVISSKQVGSENESNSSDTFQLQVEEFVNKVSLDTGKAYFNDNELCDSLILHLQIAITRVRFGMRIDNPFLKYVLENNFDLFVALKNNISIVLTSDYEIPDTEIAYVAIHFMASEEKTKEAPRVIVLCAMGLGVGQLLLQRVKSYFPNYSILGAVSLEDLKNYTSKDVDLVISTINLEGRTDLNYIVVNPLQDLSKINMSSSLELNKSRQKKLNIDFSDKDCLFISEPGEKRDLLKKTSKWLVYQGKAKSNYFNVLLKRESVGSTYIGNGTALIHGKYDEESLPASLSIIRLGKKVKWDEEHDVSMLLNFIPTDEKKADFAVLFKRIGKSIDNTEFWEKIISSDAVTMAKLFNEEFNL